MWEVLRREDSRNASRAARRAGLLLHQLAQRKLCDSESLSLAPSGSCAARQTACLNRARKVYLIGAGPGDPDLLTVKALRLLPHPPMLFVHDGLVPQAILALASPLRRSRQRRQALRREEHQRRQEINRAE